MDEISGAERGALHSSPSPSPQRDPLPSHSPFQSTLPSKIPFSLLSLLFLSLSSCLSLSRLSSSSSSSEREIMFLRPRSALPVPIGGRRRSSSTLRRQDWKTPFFASFFADFSREKWGRARAPGGPPPRYFRNFTRRRRKFQNRAHILRINNYCFFSYIINDAWYLNVIFFILKRIFCG